jgi:glutamate 5-kinase
MDAARQTLLKTPGLAVVKIGTNVLADQRGLLNNERIRLLAGQLVQIRAQGWDVILVSSGAIGAGLGVLGLRTRPTDLPHLQACAAVGQQSLMQAYSVALAEHGVAAAQLLLTASDFEHRARYLNMRNTLYTLFDYKALPIINENDTVTVAEIKFGDNDHLAALVANLMQADLLVLLSNVNGLHPGNPNDPRFAKPLETVPKITADVYAMAQSSKSHLGTGGMRSKLQAAELATQAGTAVILANGSQPENLAAIFAGDVVGTLFQPQTARPSAFKHWLGRVVRPAGALIVDAGAKVAVASKGKSLLPVGLTRVEGHFSKGAVVEVRVGEEAPFARGLTNYSSTEALQLAGLSSEQLVQQQVLAPYTELIHRNNLTLI